MSKVRKVKDPARGDRICFQFGFSGRVYCGVSAMKQATRQETEDKRKKKNGD